MKFPAKPNRLAAEKERRAQAKFRKYIRRIPDNATLVNILLSFPEKQFRRVFYDKALPYLKFKPIQFEDIQHV